VNIVKRIINIVFGSVFLKNVLLVMSGTAFVQVISGLVSPIITRIYAPEEYGILTIYTAVLGSITIVGSLKYEWGVAIAEDDDKAINILALSILVLVIFTFLVTSLLIFAGEEILALFEGKSLLRYKYFIPLGVLLTGLHNIFIQWAYREKNFQAIYKTKLSQSISQSIVKIGLGLIRIGPVGLILGSILGQSAGIATLAKPVIRKQLNLFEKLTKERIVWSAKRYKNFPLYSAPSQFFNSIGIHLPVFFLSALYGSGTIGFFGLANSIVSLPMNLIGRSVGDVFYSEAARIGRSEPQRLKELSLLLLKRLIFIGFIPFFVLILFGPFLFSIVFGERWYISGVYARILALLVFMRLLFTPISRIYSVFEKQKEALIIDLFRIILVILSFVICKLLSLNSYWAVSLYSLAMSIVYLVTFLYSQRILNLEIKSENMKPEANY